MKVKTPAFWYRRHQSFLQLFLQLLLLPFSFLFGLCAAIRRWLYRIHLLKTIDFDVPVIVVGNLTIGGTGKTPFVIWLVDFLRANGYKPGIVSRGVGKKRNKQIDESAYSVKLDDDADKVGDEALLLARNTNCPVVVGVNRAVAVQALLAQTDCNIVISDDGLQHYRLGRDLEIVMIDGERCLGNQHLLPAGPLRERPSRLQSVDFVIVNGENTQVDQAQAFISHSYVMSLQPTHCISLSNQNNIINFSDFQRQKIYAVAGIGHPQRFFTMLKNTGFDIVAHDFPDHHLYQPKDFMFAFDQSHLPIFMTEKDAVKCQSFADQRYWWVSVKAEMDAVFQEKLLIKLKSLGVNCGQEN